MPKFSLIILKKISDYRAAFSLCVSSNISFFPACEEEKENLCDFVVSMLGLLLYLKMILKIGSLMLFAIGSLDHSQRIQKL